MNLKSLKITGFTTGQSLCAHCGTGIKNLVLVRDADGATHTIGTDCALRVGLDAKQVKDRITDEQRAQNDKVRAERNARDAERAELYRTKLQARLTQVSHISAKLRSLGGDFYTSLAGQLESGTLSGNQAYYAVKAIFGRRTKANADQYDDALWLCQSTDI
jgi:hypothetical protein